MGGGKLSDALTLRQKAEAIYKERRPDTADARSESEILRLVQELEVHQIELEMVNEELLVQNSGKEKREAELIVMNKKLATNLSLLKDNKKLKLLIEEKKERAGELIIANKELVFQNEEKAKRAAELILANKELLFQNDEKTARAKELIVANIELLFQNDEKAKRAVELILANKELLLTNDENAKLSVELLLANKELLFQNDEKTHRSDELILANIELLFQNQQKEKRAQELMAANKLIAIQRDRLEEIASLVPGVIYQYRLRPDGSSYFPYVSDAIRQIYRVTPEQVREDASSIYTYVHPDDYAGVILSIMNSARDLTPWQHEYRMRFDDGSIHTLFGNSLPGLAEDGSVLWHGFVTDISERKQIEQALRQSEESFRNVVAFSPMASVVHRNKTIIYANPATLRMFGVENLTDMEGSSILDWLHPDFHESVNLRTRNSIATGLSAPMIEIKYIRRDGTIGYTEVQSTPIIYDGLPAIHVSLNDISEHKEREEEINRKNEELQKVNAEKDKFFSIIAHDLRGPLGGFMGLTEVMADETIELTEIEKKEMILGLSQSARNTFNLLENLLEWSQMNRGLTEFKPQKLGLKKAVTDCINSVAELARGKEIALIVDIPTGHEVFADNNMFQTVVRNLLSNAIKFTPKGGSVTISAKPTDNRTIVISVKDTGIGMSDQMRNDLFRIDSNTKRPGTEGEKSTGLGLLLCREFVGKQGGELWVESEQFKGTVFSFTTPWGGQNGNEISDPKVEFTEKPEGQLNNLKILIAEDDEISARLILAMFKGSYREIFQAKTGNDAIEISRNNPDIDLIMMDIAMPVMDGYEATRQIRQFNQNVIIIAQTTFALSADREKAFEVGFNDYIPKPFGKNTLIELIKKHI